MVPFRVKAGYALHSSVHRLFEGQGRKEGHFSARFGSQEGTLAHVFARKSAVYHILTSQGVSLMCFVNQEGTYAHFFWLPRGHFNTRFGSQEGT